MYTNFRNRDHMVNYITSSAVLRVLEHHDFDDKIKNKIKKLNPDKYLDTVENVTVLLEIPTTPTDKVVEHLVGLVADLIETHLNTRNTILTKIG